MYVVCPGFPHGFYISISVPLSFSKYSRAYHLFEVGMEFSFENRVKIRWNWT